MLGDNPIRCSRGGGIAHKRGGGSRPRSPSGSENNPRRWHDGVSVAFVKQHCSTGREKPRSRVEQASSEQRWRDQKKKKWRERDETLGNCRKKESLPPLASQRRNCISWDSLALFQGRGVRPYVLRGKKGKGTPGPGIRGKHCGGSKKKSGKGESGLVKAIENISSSSIWSRGC